MRESERKKMELHSDPNYRLKWLCESFSLYGDLVLKERQQNIFRRYFMTDESASSIARSYKLTTTTVFRIIWQSKCRLIRWNAEFNRACKNTKWYDVTNDDGAL